MAKPFYVAVPRDHKKPRKIASQSRGFLYGIGGRVKGAKRLTRLAQNGTTNFNNTLKLGCLLLF